MTSSFCQAISNVMEVISLVVVTVVDTSVVDVSVPVVTTVVLDVFAGTVRFCVTPVPFAITP